jgi:antitoxin component of RelBE/YafQ-DinJ toxin-antitoxin module
MCYIYYIKYMAVISIRDVQEQLRNDFKSICAKQGITMKEALVKYMEKVAKTGKLNF